MIFTPTFTAGSNIVDGASNFMEGADVNNKVLPVENFATAIKGLQAVTVTSNFTITANSEICILADASAGNLVITLPLGAQQTASSILVKKIDASANTVTVQRQGTNVIENPSNPLLIPTDTNYVIDTPNEYAEFIPTPGNTGRWRIIQRNVNRRVSTRVWLSGNTSQTGLGKIPYNTETYDIGNNYDLTLKRFTAPYKGYYDVRACCHIAVGTSAETILSVYKNGVEWERGAALTTGNAGNVNVSSMIFLDKNEYVEIWLDLFNNVNRVLGGSNHFTWATFNYIKD